MQILISLSEQSHCLPQVTSTTNNVLGVKEYKIASNVSFNHMFRLKHLFFTPMLVLLQIFLKVTRYPPNAAAIFEHPWFNSAQSKKKMMMDLLIEMNADAQEKLVTDGDEESVTESYENSQTPPSPISKSSVKFSIPSSVTTTLDHKQSSTVLILHDQSVNRHDNRHDTRDISPTSELSSSFEKSVNLSFQKLEPADHAEYIVSKQQLRKVTSTMQEHAFAHAKSQNHLSNTSSPKPRQSALSEGREPSKRIMSATSTPARSKQLHNMQIVISLSEQSHRFPQMTSTTNNVLGVKEGSLSAQLHDLRRSKKLKQSESS
ncbi:hypothetical protein L3Y34_011460 [Caenorhabditis briggsae]|uniref:Protein kinase domain-containing protein n=1 Tax=Caenorhabditis briggsae TaxID=6238 RepID=A0AAE8ZUB8_CAEBR|nr:hypothetical protein L3Y34_011460 [Caenorhabditis briggsae]